MFSANPKADTAPGKVSAGVLLTKFNCRRRRLLPRMDVLCEGESTDSMYLLVTGWAARYRSFEDGRRQIMAILIPGDLCHFDIMSDMPHQNSVCALTPTQVDVVPRRGLRQQMETDPELFHALWKESLASAAIQEEWTINIGRRSAPERLGHLFCEIFLRLKAIGCINGDSCDFPLTQPDLADAIGLTPVHINRTLQHLRSLGLVILNRRKLTIPDLDRLQDFSLFKADYLHLSDQPVSSKAERPLELAYA